MSPVSRAGATEPLVRLVRYWKGVAVRRWHKAWRLSGGAPGIDHGALRRGVMEEAVEEGAAWAGPRSEAPLLT